MAPFCDLKVYCNMYETLMAVTLEITFILIYLLTAIVLTPSGSSTVQYTFTHKQYIEQWAG